MTVLPGLRLGDRLGEQDDVALWHGRRAMAYQHPPLVGLNAGFAVLGQNLGKRGLEVMAESSNPVVPLPKLGM